MIRIRTPVKQYAYTGLSEILTPMKRNLHVIYISIKRFTIKLHQKTPTSSHSYDITNNLFMFDFL